MANGHVILTRGQWEAIWNQADAVRDATTELSGLIDALNEFGLRSPVAKLERARTLVAKGVWNIHKTLIDAEEAPKSNPETGRAG